MWIGIDPVETHRARTSIGSCTPRPRTSSWTPRHATGSASSAIVDKGGNPWETGWWRYRVPGRGQVDWPRVVDRLYEAGFDGVLSVEHEDPLWGGTEPKVLQGLTIAQQTLRPLIVPETN